MKSGIYKITNPNDKVYIGKATDLVRRKNAYRGLFCVKQPKIYNSLKKYGWELHKFEIIELCPIEELIDKEISYKEEFIFHNGWEMALFIHIRNEGGGVFSKETKQKISDSKKNHPMYNDEWRFKIGISLKERNHSQHYTEEVRKKMSRALKGRKNSFSDEHKFNIALANLISKGKVVECYDLNDNLIETFNCLREAKEWLLIQNPNISINVDKQIKDCCNNRQKKCHGYKFKYKI